MSEDGGDTNVSLFCSDSPYDEHVFKQLGRCIRMYSDDDTEDGNSDPLGMGLYHNKLVGLSKLPLT